MSFFQLAHPIKWLFLSHALAGAIALIVLIVPMVTKKGGSIHIKAGWIYVYSMLFVIGSSFIITPWRVFFDDQRALDHQLFSIFLFYISIFSFSSILYGLNSIKNKNRIDKNLHPILIIPPIATLFIGFFIQVLGVQYQNGLLIYFPFLGHFTNIGILKYWMTKPTFKMHWWIAHMNGMFTSCIATITAFLVTALPRIWSSPFTHSIWLWIAPGIILGTIANQWSYFYIKKFNSANE